MNLLRHNIDKSAEEPLATKLTGSILAHVNTWARFSANAIPQMVALRPIAIRNVLWIVCNHHFKRNPLVPAVLFRLIARVVKHCTNRDNVLLIFNQVSACCHQCTERAFSLFGLLWRYIGTGCGYHRQLIRIVAASIKKIYGGNKNRCKQSPLHENFPLFMCLPQRVSQ